LTHTKCINEDTIDGCFSALSYNKTTQKVIYNFKQKSFLTDLKTVLSELFYESIIQNEDFNREFKKGDWILVPIPLFTNDFRKRGYNQAGILASMLAKDLKLKSFNVLDKTKDTFLIKKGFEIKNINIFLIDDVVKTGTTLKQAASVLKKSGAGKVLGLTLARR
jgi:predicted amidophosphoribosyltransferase